MVLQINGVDIVPYIAYNGLKWSRNDVESPEAGRSLDSMMHRGRISTKIRLDVTLKLLKLEELRMILNLIQPEYVTVYYDDPLYGLRYATMYSNNIPASYQIKKGDREYWTGVTFPLIER